MKLNYDNRDLPLLILDVLLARSKLFPNKIRDHDVKNRFKLQETAHLFVAIYELSFLLKLLDINVAGPD